MKKTFAIAAIGAIALVGIAAPASAEPQGAPLFRDLAGMGSDTTFGLMNSISNQVRVTGSFQAENDTAANPTTYTNELVIASYDPQGSATVQTKDAAEFAGCTAVTRRNGSGAGRTGLTASIAAGDNCLQFARSSSSPVVATITFVPLAVDALTFATAPNPDSGTTLSIAELTSIYNNPGTPGNASCGIIPLLPQVGSGTRGDWAAFVGYTFTATGAVQPTECATDIDANGNSVQEHNGNNITRSNEIAPFSVAQYIAQSYGAQPDRRNNVTLGAITNAAGVVTYPIAINAPGNVGTVFAFTRTVGNYVSETDFNNAASLEYKVFRGPGTTGPNDIATSEICVDAGRNVPGTSTDIISQLGFLNTFCQ